MKFPSGEVEFDASGYGKRSRVAIQRGTAAMLYSTLKRTLALCGPHRAIWGQRIMAKIEVKSEITGTVWQIKAKPGDKVEDGDTLIVIESMKMEIPVITEDGGTVKEILVKEKDPVAEGQVVAILEG
jgi:acetyl-CoA carboxylase biotin carboxyl carrier protein